MRVAKTPHRLLVVATGLGFGGAEAQLSALARRFHEDPNWDVRVVSMLPLEGWAESLQTQGIAVGSLHMRRGRPDPRALFALARIFRQWRPHVVHAHMVHANLLARLARIWAPVPALVCTAHNVDEGGRRREWAYRLTDRLSDITTQVSRAGAERYVRIRAVAPRRMRFIPNGVDVDAFAPRPIDRSSVLPPGARGRFVFLAVGRLEPQKDYPNLIAATARLRQDRPDALVLHLGDGPLRRELSDRAARAGQADGISFLGFESNIAAWLNAAEAMVLSSAYEGLPMVLLEAMSSGLPVVSTNVGGVPEAITEGVHGFLAPPKDASALAAAMARMMDQTDAQRRTLGAAARSRIVNDFSVAGVTGRWRELYEELLAAANA